ncbi:NAD(P)-binding domain-containing protein [Pedobacter terrae]|uniref:NAD(P)-binding domain-containing protein n=1 Tax=Pedobacter terrae TaxID=405671 RepID=UPI003FA75726
MYSIKKWANFQNNHMLDNQKHYDVLIIGAGPIGMACAIEAEKANLSYLVIEKGALVNSLFNYPVFMTFFSTSQKLEIGGGAFCNHQPEAEP